MKRSGAVCGVAYASLGGARATGDRGQGRRTPGAQVPGRRRSPRPTRRVPVPAPVQGTRSPDIGGLSKQHGKNGVIARYQYSTVSRAARNPRRFIRTRADLTSRTGNLTRTTSSFGLPGLLRRPASRGTSAPARDVDNPTARKAGRAPVTGRTTTVAEADPSRGPVGFAYKAPCFESADTPSSGRCGYKGPHESGCCARTWGSGTPTSPHEPTAPWSWVLDTATGLRVGNRITFNGIQPGELRQISDVWASAQIPATVTSVIAFADVLNPTSTSPTIEGYATIIDGQGTQDAAFFELKCADTDACGN